MKVFWMSLAIFHSVVIALNVGGMVARGVTPVATGSTTLVALLFIIAVAAMIGEK